MQARIGLDFESKRFDKDCRATVAAPSERTTAELGSMYGPTTEARVRVEPPSNCTRGLEAGELAINAGTQKCSKSGMSVAILIVSVGVAGVDSVGVCAALATNMFTIDTFSLDTAADRISDSDRRTS